MHAVPASGCAAGTLQLATCPDARPKVHFDLRSHCLNTQQRLRAGAPARSQKESTLACPASSLHPPPPATQHQMGQADLQSSELPCRCDMHASGSGVKTELLGLGSMLMLSDV